MNLKSYLSGKRGRVAELAKRLAVSPSYVTQMASGKTPISPERCVEIEQQTAGEVTRQELRPDDWERIWPELRSAHCGGRRRDDPPAPPAPQAGSATEGHE